MYSMFVSLPHIIAYVQQTFELQHRELSKPEIALLAAVEDPTFSRCGDCAMAVMGMELINPGHIRVKNSALKLACHCDTMLAALASSDTKPLVTGNGRRLGRCSLGA